MKISLLEFNKREDKVSMSISEFKKIEHLARIGEATEKAFKDGYTFCFKRPDGTILECIKGIEELMEGNK